MREPSEAAPPRWLPLFGRDMTAAAASLKATLVGAFEAFFAAFGAVGFGGAGLAFGRPRALARPKDIFFERRWGLAGVWSRASRR